MRKGIEISAETMSMRKGIEMSVETMRKARLGSKNLLKIALKRKFFHNIRMTCYRNEISTAEVNYANKHF